MSSCYVLVLLFVQRNAHMQLNIASVRFLLQAAARSCVRSVVADEVTDTSPRGPACSVSSMDICWQRFADMAARAVPCGRQRLALSRSQSQPQLAVSPKLKTTPTTRLLAKVGSIVHHGLARGSLRPGPGHGGGRRQSHVKATLGGAGDDPRRTGTPAGHSRPVDSCGGAACRSDPRAGRLLLGARGQPGPYGPWRRAPMSISRSGPADPVRPSRETATGRRRHGFDSTGAALCSSGLARTSTPEHAI